LRQEIIMEHAYWLGRQRDSLVLARTAATSEARLIHYELAGRYHLKALSAEGQAIGRAGALPAAGYANAASGFSKQAASND
jgi:hypothetical protein